MSPLRGAFHLIWAGKNTCTGTQRRSKIAGARTKSFDFAKTKSDVGKMGTVLSCREHIYPVKQHFVVHDLNEHDLKSCLLYFILFIFFKL